jgi:hypothetical protein
MVQLGIARWRAEEADKNNYEAEQRLHHDYIGRRKCWLQTEIRKLKGGLGSTGR